MKFTVILFMTMIVMPMLFACNCADNSTESSKTQEEITMDDCIVITTPTEKEVKEKGYKDWPIWTGSARTYPTKTYSSTEYCYFIKGEVKVVTASGKEYFIKPGDLVIFKKGCTCTWIATKAVEKHYRFM